MTEDSQKWVPVIDHLLWQTYYRLLSFISFHGPIDQAYEAATQLSTIKKGTVYWIVPYKIFRWDGVELSPGITMNVWFFGGKGNTVMCRVGWFKFYIFESFLRR